MAVIKADCLWMSTCRWNCRCAGGLSCIAAELGTGAAVHSRHVPACKHMSGKLSMTFTSWVGQGTPVWRCTRDSTQRQTYVSPCSVGCGLCSWMCTLSNTVFLHHSIPHASLFHLKVAFCVIGWMGHVPLSFPLVFQGAAALC